MQTIGEILGFLRDKDTNIKRISKETGISSDRLYSWRQKRGTPKAEDANRLLEWAKKNRNSSNRLEEIQTKTNNMETSTPDYIQELINSLKKNIEVLEKNSAEKDDRVKSLLQINSDLKIEVREHLKTVLDNQLTLTALFESYLKSFSSLMIDEPEQQQEFRLVLHKEAFVRLTGLLRTGKHLAFDNENIISKEP